MDEYDRSRLVEPTERGELILTDEQLTASLNVIKWEQEQLYSYKAHHEDGKMPFIKSAITIFSLFVTGMIALFAAASKYDINIFKVEEYYILFSIVVIGLCFINLAIIKYIVWKRAEGIKISRQINCNRQAIDSILYHSLVGNYPPNEEKLRKRKTLYGETLGKHRKLETNNDPLREGQEFFFKSLPLSPDNFMVLVITSFTFLSLILPNIFWLIHTDGSSTAMTYFSGVISSMFLLVVVWHVRSSQKMIQLALKSNKDASHNKLPIVKNG